MRILELKRILEDLDDDMEVRFASQPQWAFEYEISDVMPVGDILYLVEGDQIGYLPEKASQEIGWSNKPDWDNRDEEMEDYNE